jgi:nuclear protein localization family protein 4
MKAELVEASTDPSLILAKQSASGYTPEIFYSQRNEYGREVKLVAKPTFPVEYLLVTLTHGFPNESRCLFLRHSFPSVYDESRAEQVLKSWSLQDDKALLGELSSFNALLYLFIHNMFTDIKLLTQCIINPQNMDTLTTLFTSTSWQTLIDSLLTRRESMVSSHAASQGTEWTCIHCTFINKAVREECEMCSLPR